MRTSDARSWLVSDPKGTEYEIRIERAPRPTMWSHGPWRFWSFVTRDHSWWLTVESSLASLPVVREKYLDASKADASAQVLAQNIASGAYDLPNHAALRRVKRH